LSVLQLQALLLLEFDKQFHQFEFKRWFDVAGFYGHRYDRWRSELRQSVDPAISVCNGQLQLDMPYISVTVSSVEDLVARFQEQPASEMDVSVRSTLGFRPERNGILPMLHLPKILKNEKHVVSEARSFVPWVIHKGEPFWQHFSDSRMILKVLADEEGNASQYGAGTSSLKAIKAIALTFILSGLNPARQIAEKKILSFQATDRLKTANEVRRWVERAIGG
jgi:hypothetical protein